MISKSDVIKASKLVNIEISEQEANKLTQLFSETLEKIKTLEELDITDVVETYQVTGLKNVYSDPELNKATLSKEESLENSRNTKNGLFATKAVFER